jgi:hypothetical protein
VPNVVSRNCGVLSMKRFAELMQCRTEKEQRALFDLALTWTEAALKADSLERVAQVARCAPSAVFLSDGDRTSAPMRMRRTHYG